MGNWKSKDPPLIKTEIEVGSATLIHVFTLTCMKVKFIGIRKNAHFVYFSLTNYFVMVFTNCGKWLG